jgi:hypothetical protein
MMIKELTLQTYQHWSVDFNPFMSIKIPIKANANCKPMRFRLYLNT